MNLYTGTSGFSYKEWKGTFYPEDLSEKEMLSYYAGQLKAVEINNSFYRMPKENVLKSWVDQVNDDFKFSIKASRKITHFKRLKDTAEECEFLFKNVKILQEHLCCILFQLPPNLKQDIDLFKSFLKQIPENISAAFEFRHPSWMDEETFDLLKNKNCSLVITETDEEPQADFTKTADWVYLRLRRTHYTEAELKERMEKIKNSSWDNVYVFFKHEDEGTGPALAKKFIELYQLSEQ